MSQAPSVAFAVVAGDPSVAGPALVSLKGTTRGLEILISSAPSADALAARLSELLAEAPGFFAGSAARVAFEGALPVGALGCLEAVAARFQLTIVELGPVSAKRARTFASVVRRNDLRPGKLAEGTGPIAEAAAPSAELPALPSGTSAAAASDAAAASSAAAAADAAAAAIDVPEATPLEVALANTAPYSIADLTSEPDARLGAATPVLGPDTEPARTAAAIEAAVAHAVDAIGSVATADAIASAIADADSEILAAELIGDIALEAIASELNTASEIFAPAPPAIDPAVELAERAAAIEDAAQARAAELIAALPPSPRLVIGPVRSGVIVDHPGHVVIIGDVNPGAEVRAVGSIIVLGRLRGVAHAAIGRDAGCIVALSLQPQQLRIGRMVARAGDADRPSDAAEIAYVTGEAIVVERFVGRLPSGLAASM